MIKNQIYRNLTQIARRFDMPFTLESILYIPDFHGKISQNPDSFEICILLPACRGKHKMSFSEHAVFFVLCPEYQEKVFQEKTNYDILLFSYSRASEPFLRNCAIRTNSFFDFIVSSILVGLLEEMLIRLNQADIRGNADRLDYLVLQYILEASLNTRIENPPTSNLKNWDLILEIAMYTDSHIIDGVTVDVLCRHFSISRRTLFRLWKQHFTSTPAAYISCKRAELARHLLQRTDLNGNEIAERCGYSSAAYFSSSFRHEMGMTPSEYRKNPSRIL